jgi:hypothetical protein
MENDDLKEMYSKAFKALVLGNCSETHVVARFLDEKQATVLKHWLNGKSESRDNTLKFCAVQRQHGWEVHCHSVVDLIDDYKCPDCGDSGDCNKCFSKVEPYL